MQAELKDELHAKCHHRVRDSDSVANKVASPARFELRVKPVQIVARVNGQGLQKVGRDGGLCSVDVEGDETVNEEGGFGGVDVSEDFVAESGFGGEDVIEVVVFVEEIPEEE